MKKTYKFGHSILSRTAHVLFLAKLLTFNAASLATTATPTQDTRTAYLYLSHDSQWFYRTEHFIWAGRRQTQWIIECHSDGLQNATHNKVARKFIRFNGRSNPNTLAKRRNIDERHYCAFWCTNRIYHSIGNVWKNTIFSIFGEFNLPNWTNFPGVLCAATHTPEYLYFIKSYI